MKNTIERQTKLKLALFFSLVLIGLTLYGLAAPILDSLGGTLIGIYLIYCGGNISSSWVNGRVEEKPKEVLGEGA